MLKSIIRKHVLKNIADYGKADPGSVTGKVIAEFPDAKKDVKSIMQKIKEEIARASGLSREQLENEMKEFTYSVKEEKQKVISLPNVKGKTVTRFPPEPSGYLHIGHAKASWIDYEGARVNGGYMILRFDDTNPEKESQEYADSIKHDLEWLGIKWEKETYTSDKMELLYKAAKILIENDAAYVCTSSQESVRQSRTDGKPVPDRSLSKEENLRRWNDMLDGKYNPGEAILLFKGNLKSSNTALRDPTLARIITTHHFRKHKQYRVWPGYDLAVVVMDHEEGITHSMRSKEYELRDDLYRQICTALGWKVPELVGFSRLAIKNAPISKRLITPLVMEGKVSGWDDPRLPTLAGLRRRGILPEAIRQFVLQIGLSKVDSEPDWEVLLSYNRKLLDHQAPHYFFVRDPVKIEVQGLGEKTILLKKHPKHDLGEREIRVTETIYIDSMDAPKDGEKLRLKDLCNIEYSGGKAKLLGEEILKKKIQWVSDPVKCKILVPKDLLKDGEYDPESMEVLEGYCEKACQQLKPGTTIQFERFGFCRLDRDMTFIFSC
ncbi:glutamate--tRNA ligase [Candidatus Micrarchaeota archaeon]|nr:glutamate--tRNA ligase [Candidatus Micrarchaeota archaeon]